MKTSSEVNHNARFYRERDISLIGLSGVDYPEDIESSPPRRIGILSVPDEVGVIYNTIYSKNRKPRELSYEEVKAIDNFINDINNRGLDEKYKLMTMLVGYQNELYRYSKVEIPPNTVYRVEGGNLVESGSAYTRSVSATFFGDRLVRLRNKLVIVNDEFNLGVEVVDRLDIIRYIKYDAPIRPDESAKDWIGEYQKFKEKLSKILLSLKKGTNIIVREDQFHQEKKKDNI